MSTFARTDDEPASSGTGRREWVWLAVVAAVLFGYPLAVDIPLFDPDEGLHAAIAQEMTAERDFVTPRLFGEPFLDKPILYFWAQCLSLSLIGAHEAAVRLPGLLFGLLGAVTAWRLGRELFGEAAGRLAGLFQMTLILPLAVSQAAVHDVALVPWTNLAVLAGWRAMRAETGEAGRDYLLVGLWLGLAILTKGLIGVALVGVALGLWVLVERRLSLRLVVGFGVALVLAALVASPWYVLMERAHPGYLRYYFVERHLYGYVTSTQRHGHRVWWYYVPLLLGGGMPWLAYLPAAWSAEAAGPGGAAVARRAAARRLLWCWLGGGWLFLTLAHSKLLTYVLPLCPAIALLAADVWQRRLEGRLVGWGRRWVSVMFWVSCGAALVAVPITMRVVHRRLGVEFGAGHWLAGWTIGLSLLVGAAAFATGRLRGALVASSASLAVIFAFLMTFLVPPIAETLSARALAEHLNRTVERLPRVLVVQERIGSLVFYLRPELRRAIGPGQLRELDVAQLGSLPGLESDDLVAVPHKRVARVEAQVALVGLPYQEVGHYRLFRARQLQARLPVPLPAGETVTARTESRTAPGRPR